MFYQIVKNISARGGTNINSALVMGLQVINTNKDPQSHQPLIIFLTDGEPNVGISNTEEITKKVINIFPDLGFVS